jgi:uncharacterized protein (TIGR02246 family)
MMPRKPIPTTTGKVNAQSDESRTGRFAAITGHSIGIIDRLSEMRSHPWPGKSRALGETPNHGRSSRTGLGDRGTVLSFIQRPRPHTMLEMDSTDEVLAVLADFDRWFASGDAESLSDMFTSDAQLLLLHREAIVGRSAIMSHWTRVFGAYDPGAWQTEPQKVEVHGDHAYALSFYSETLVNRSGGASLMVWGRLVFFMRRDPDEKWRMATVLNSHVRPVEHVPSQPGEGS